ncbi:MAG TPA: hypothetical protein VF395_00180 [Polyangiaceae bacterium]
MSPSVSPPGGRVVQRVKALFSGLGTSERAAIGIAIAGFLLRLVRRSPVWGGSDAADLPALVEQMVCEPGNVAADLRKLALFRLGGVEATALYLQMSAMSLLHLRVSEFHWELPALLVGTANVYLGFLVARELAGPKAGVLAAILLSVCPLGIIQSRHLGAPWMYEQFCQFFLTYLLLRLAREPTLKGGKVAFHATLAAYFWTGNQMPGIAPVLVYGLAAAAVERDRTERASHFLWDRYGGKFVLLPVLSLGTLLYFTFVRREGHLAHALFDKRHETGFYVEHWFDDMSSDLGPGITWFGIAALVIATASVRGIFSKARLPVILFLAYASPFWFLIPPGTTLTRGYITYGVGAMLLVLASALFLAESRPLARILFPAVAALMLLVNSGQSAFHLYQEKLLSVKGFQGSFTPNNGVKTAALFIRSRPRTNGRVFSDASGGTGLEPPLMGIYFDRPHFSLYDAFPATLPYARFQKQADDIDYLVVLPANRRLVEQYFGEAFQEALRVTEEGRGELLLVYARAATFASRASMDVSVGDRQFDARYSLLCGG